MSPRERAKRVQVRLLKAADGALVSRELKESIGELVLMVGEFADVLESLQTANAKREGGSDGR